MGAGGSNGKMSDERRGSGRVEENDDELRRCLETPGGAEKAVSALVQMVGYEFDAGLTKEARVALDQRRYRS